MRVDEGEHALFKGAAERARVSISVFARDAMLARMALERQVAEPPVTVVRRVLPEEMTEALNRSARGATECRHGLASCRICKTGRFQEDG